MSVTTATCWLIKKISQTDYYTWDMSLHCVGLWKNMVTVFSEMQLNFIVIFWSCNKLIVSESCIVDLWELWSLYCVVLIYHELCWFIAIHSLCIHCTSAAFAYYIIVCSDWCQHNINKFVLYDVVCHCNSLCFVMHQDNFTCFDTAFLPKLHLLIVAIHINSFF